jgi:hypothetical protein
MLDSGNACAIVMCAYGASYIEQELYCYHLDSGKHYPMPGGLRGQFGTANSAFAPTASRHLVFQFETVVQSSQHFV